MMLEMQYVYLALPASIESPECTETKISLRCPKPHFVRLNNFRLA